MDDMGQPLRGQGTRKMMWGRFFWNLSAVVALFVVFLFTGFFIHDKRILDSELLKRGRMHYHTALMLRRWNNSYGGVYVEQGRTVGVHAAPSSPVERPEISGNADSDIVIPEATTRNGTVLQRKSGESMSHELSDMLNTSGMFRVKMITFADADMARSEPFERRALQVFATERLPEIFTEYTENGRNYFLYVAPLMTREGCTSCHGGQRYSKEDLRGAISIRFDLTERKREEARRDLVLVLFCSLTLAGLLTGMYVLTRRMKHAMQRSQEYVERMAVTDELTGLYNRRYAYGKVGGQVQLAQRHTLPFSCLMLDIDHFKHINDTYGHPSGDMVLKSLASLILGSCRSTDIAARFGGEEFIVLLPSTDVEGAAYAAEKLRETVENAVFTIMHGQVIRLTVSIGGASLLFEDAGDVVSADGLIAVADAALYEAKNNGRNRVVTRVVQTAAASASDGELSAEE